MADKLRITMKKSQIGCSKHQRKVLAGLGLRRRHQTVEIENTPATRGMVEKVAFLLDVREI